MWWAEQHYGQEVDQVITKLGTHIVTIMFYWVNMQVSVPNILCCALVELDKWKQL